MLKIILIASAAATVMPTTLARAQDGSPARAYTVRYDVARDRYCIRFFSDALAADPRPGRPAARCRSRAAWAKERVFIRHTLKEAATPPPSSTIMG